MPDRDASRSCTDVIFEAFASSRVAETRDFAAAVIWLRIAQTDVATGDAHQRMLLPAGICDHPPVAKASRGQRVLWLAEWIHRSGTVPPLRAMFPAGRDADNTPALQTESMEEVPLCAT